MATYRGISTIEGEFGERILYDINLAKQDLLNHFYTKQGERVMAPLFGSKIWEYLFEPMTQELVRKVEEDVLRIISQDPRWTLLGTDISSSDHQLLVRITAEYIPETTEEQIVLAFNRNTSVNNP